MLFLQKKDILMPTDVTDTWGRLVAIYKKYRQLQRKPICYVSKRITKRKRNVKKSKRLVDN